MYVPYHLLGDRLNSKRDQIPVDNMIIAFVVAAVVSVVVSPFQVIVQE